MNGVWIRVSLGCSGRSVQKGLAVWLTRLGLAYALDAFIVDARAARLSETVRLL